MTHNNVFHTPAIGGIWALQQSYTGLFSTYASDVNQALALPWVTGFCFRVPWNQIESNTVQGSYSFTQLEAALTACRNAGKKFSVRPISGRYTPTYVYNTLGARSYAVTGGNAPHPCNTNGTPNTIWLNRFTPFMQALFDWANTKGGDVPYIHGSHFSNQYSEFYHGTQVRSPTTGYDSAGTNFIEAHKVLWAAVYGMASSSVATEFGMSGTHVEDIQIRAVEYIHSLAGDWNGRILINCNGEAGVVAGGTDWGASTETQQDQNCGFAVNGVFNPPTARKVSRMAQMIQPGGYSASYWHNVFLSLRSNRMEGVEIYIGDGTPVGAPGKSFQGTSGAALAIEAQSWLSEIVGSPPTQAQATIATVFPKFTQAMTGHRWVTGTITSPFPAFTQTMSGAVESPSLSGTIGQAFPAITQAMTAERDQNEAAVAQTFPAFTQAMSGVRDIPTSGDAVISSVFPHLTQAMVAAMTVPIGTAVIVNTFPSFTQDQDAAVAGLADTTQSFPAITQDMTGRSSSFRYIHPVSAVEILDGTGLILPNPPLRRPAFIPIGLYDRTGVPDTSGSGVGWSGLDPTDYLSGMVVNVNWSELQPTTVDEPFPTSNSITEAITAATNAGLHLKVRVFFGSGAPDWAKGAGGGVMTMVEPQSGNTFTCGEWWNTDYMAAVTVFWSQFAEVFNPYTLPDGPISDVAMGGAMTRFVEQDIRQNANIDNRTLLAARGYTLEADLESQANSIDAHLPIRCVTSRACNPYQVGITQNNVPAYTINLMQYARQTLGLYGALGNNSDRIEAGWPTSNLALIYATITSLGPPSYIQTAAPARVGDTYATCLNAVGYGATYIELPGTTAQYTADDAVGLTPAQMTSINTSLLANAATIGY